MKRNHELEARIFLRSFKDAEFCLFHTSYKEKLIANYVHHAEEVKNSYQNKLINNNDFKNIESYKLFQFSQYALEKYFARCFTEDETIDHQSVLKTIKSIGLDLNKQMQKFGLKNQNQE